MGCWAANRAPATCRDVAFRCTDSDTCAVRMADAPPVELRAETDPLPAETSRKLAEDGAGAGASTRSPPLPLLAETDGAA
jgi:hypothetical protein